MLKSSDVLDILVPILFHLNDARSDQCEFCCSFLGSCLTVLPGLFSCLLSCTFLNYRTELLKMLHLFPARLGLMHIGVFILLLLSGERNFGRYMDNYTHVWCIFKEWSSQIQICVPNSLHNLSDSTMYSSIVRDKMFANHALKSTASRQFLVSV